LYDLSFLRKTIYLGRLNVKKKIKHAKLFREPFLKVPDMEDSTSASPLWGLAVERVLPMLAAEKKKAFVDHILTDPEMREYLIKKVEDDVIKHLTTPTDDPLEDDDIVAVTLDLGQKRICLLHVNQMSWRIGVVVKRLWRDQKSISIDFNNYSPDNICTETYLECLEEERIDKCIPRWEDPEAHDVSDYAQPGTVLHDAYVVHAIGNEDAVLEKLHEKIYEIEEIAWEKGRAFDMDTYKRKCRLVPQPRAEIYLKCIH
jgi:hypothetical protein